MRLMPSLFLTLLLALSSCGTAPVRYEVLPSPRGRGALDPHLQALHKTLVRSAVKLETKMGSGTGFAVLVKDGKTYFLTCDHVVEEVDSAVVISCQRNGFSVEAGAVVARKPEWDLALVVVDSIHPVLSLAGEGEYRDTPIGASVLSAGWTGDIKPAIISYGWVEELTSLVMDVGWGLSHTASGWFGFSGGPVLDVKTGKVLGVNARIFRAHANYMWAVPSYHAESLLEAVRG